VRGTAAPACPPGASAYEILEKVGAVAYKLKLYLKIVEFIQFFMLHYLKRQLQQELRLNLCLLV
jgi:hypothetical protein